MHSQKGSQIRMLFFHPQILILFMKCIDTGNIYLYQASTKKKTENKSFSFPIKLNMKKKPLQTESNLFKPTFGDT